MSETEQLIWNMFASLKAVGRITNQYLSREQLNVAIKEMISRVIDTQREARIKLLNIEMSNKQKQYNTFASNLIQDNT